ILKPLLHDMIGLFDLPINKLSILSISHPIIFPVRCYIPEPTRTTSLGTFLILASACVTVCHLLLYMPWTGIDVIGSMDRGRQR
ncbi:hypothetical protein COCC4DRAFT_148644, partial [Bipolaris maydis ATCC 48331]